MSEASEFWREATTVLPLIFGIEALRYLIAASLLSVIIAAFWGAWFKARKLQPRSATARDYRREILTSLRTSLIFAVIGFGMHLASKEGLLTIYATFETRGPFYFAVTVAAMIVAHDAYFYWTHRAMHHPRLFQAVHATHHRSRTPTPWTAYAFDVPEAFVMLAFVPLWAAIVPMHDLGLFAFMTWQIVRNVMGHAGVECSPVTGRPSRLFGWLNTTTHHDLHHQDSRVNFGLYFTWWDRFMGTEHPDYQTRVGVVAENGRRKRPIRSQRTGAATAMVAVLIGAAGHIADARAQTPDIYGDWATQGFGAVVRLHPCEANADHLCGRLIWVWNPEDVERDAVGALMLRDFVWDKQAWRKGTLRNPKDGRTYRGSISPDGDILRLKGCAGPFCESETWRRLSSVPRP